MVETIDVVNGQIYNNVVGNWDYLKSDLLFILIVNYQLSIVTCQLI